MQLVVLFPVCNIIGHKDVSCICVVRSVCFYDNKHKLTNNDTHRNEWSIETLKKCVTKMDVKN